MNRYWRLCAKRLRSALFLTGWLWGCVSCDVPLKQLSDTERLIEYLEVYRLEQTLLPDTPSPDTQALKKILSRPVELDAMLVWAQEHPKRFSALMAAIGNEKLNNMLSRRAVDMGKSFLLLERLDRSANDEVADLLVRIEELEYRDGRDKVSMRRLPLSSPLTRIVKFQGRDNQIQWKGAALLLAESECQLGLATAGHNLLTKSGSLRAPLDDLRIEIAHVDHPLVEVLSMKSPVEPEQDWIIAIADKIHCGKNYDRSELAMADKHQLPTSGLQVGLYCFHQGDQDVMSTLYGEQCQIFPAEAGVLDHYQNRSENKLGIHNCVSEKGSSGCPIFYQDQGVTYFLATQIERDSITGAGIARLFSDDFYATYERLKSRFARDDIAYRASQISRF